MEKIKSNHRKPPIDQQGLFMTAPNSFYQGQKLRNCPIQYSQHIQGNQQQIQVLRNQILPLIMQLKSMQNYPQIKQLFNQILYSLDTSSSGKRNAQQISVTLKEQRNLIKLRRIWNQLRGLKKDYQKLASSLRSVDKKPKTSQLNRTKLNSRNVTLDLMLPSQEQQWKQILAWEISYRQRIQNRENQDQKHFKNKKEFIHKKLQKVKQMNKRVKDVHDTIRRKHKQQISRHKYETIFYPEEVQKIKRRRGQTMNRFNRSKIHSEQKDIVGQSTLGFCDKDSPFKNNAQNPFNANSFSSKKLPFATKEQEKYIRKDIGTLKSFKQLFALNTKTSKSYKSIPNKNNVIFQGKSIHKTINCSHLNSPQISKSQSLCKNQMNLNSKLNNLTDQQKKFQQKYQEIKEKKQILEEQKYNKFIAQAVNKQKKIMMIFSKRNSALRTKKNSGEHSSDSSRIRSFDNSSTKSSFKKPIALHKQLMDQQRKIFLNIQKKVQNKQMFLQQRVNRIRERLKQQQWQRQKHQQNWDQYIILTQNVSIMQSRQKSPIKKHLKGQQSEQNIFNHNQELVIKKAYDQSTKKQQKNLKRQKLCNLSMAQLKKKLQQIQHKQLKNSSKNAFF